MKNLYVAANEKFIASLEAPCPTGDVRVRLGLPVRLGRFGMVPHEDQMIHLTTLPGFYTRDMRYCT